MKLATPAIILALLVSFADQAMAQAVFPGAGELWIYRTTSLLSECPQITRNDLEPDDIPEGYIITHDFIGNNLIWDGDPILDYHRADFLVELQSNGGLKILEGTFFSGPTNQPFFHWIPEESSWSAAEGAVVYRNDITRRLFVYTGFADHPYIEDQEERPFFEWTIDAKGLEDHPNFAQYQKFFDMPTPYCNGWLYIATMTQVPEPSSAVLAMTGILALVGLGRRHRAKLA